MQNFRFSLIDHPWLPVTRDGKTVERVSLADLFAPGSVAVDIAEEPRVRYALYLFLIALGFEADYAARGGYSAEPPASLGAFEQSVRDYLSGDGAAPLTDSWSMLKLIVGDKVLSPREPSLCHPQHYIGSGEGQTNVQGWGIPQTAESLFCSMLGLQLWFPGHCGQSAGPRGDDKINYLLLGETITQTMWLAIREIKKWSKGDEEVDGFVIGRAGWAVNTEENRQTTLIGKMTPHSVNVEFTPTGLLTSGIVGRTTKPAALNLTNFGTIPRPLSKTQKKENANVEPAAKASSAVGWAHLALLPHSSGCINLMASVPDALRGLRVRITYQAIENSSNVVFVREHSYRLGFRPEVGTKLQSAAEILAKNEVALAAALRKKANAPIMFPLADGTKAHFAALAEASWAQLEADLANKDPDSLTYWTEEMRQNIEKVISQIPITSPDAAVIVSKLHNNLLKQYIPHE